MSGAAARASPFRSGGSIATFGISRSIGIYMCVAYALVLFDAGLLREIRGMELTPAVKGA
jgi:predicted RND superfamily exporter protein